MDANPNIESPISSRDNDWWRRAVRTGLQLIASGALYALTDQFAKDVEPQYAPYVLGGYTLLVAGVQNFLEDNTGMPAILKGRPSAGINPAPEPSPVNPLRPDTWANDNPRKEVD